MTQEQWWKFQYKTLHEFAIELVNKIKYTDDLYAVFTIKDCEQYQNLKERLDKIPPKE